jgi:hypothetical protein
MNILSRVLVTIDGVWVGEYINCPLIGCNYKQLLRYICYPHYKSLHTNTSQFISTSHYLVTANLNWQFVCSVFTRRFVNPQLNTTTELNFQLFSAYCYIDSGWTSCKTRVTCHNVWSLVPYTGLAMARITEKTPVLMPECVFIGPLPSTGHGADHIENTSPNTFPMTACAYFGRCLERGIHVTI